jgi:hypothetical protein
LFIRTSLEAGGVEAPNLKEDPVQHGNAPLTPLGRRRLVALVEDDGLTSRSTAHDWVWRRRRASKEQADLSCLEALLGTAPSAVR